MVCLVYNARYKKEKDFLSSVMSEICIRASYLTKEVVTNLMCRVPFLPVCLFKNNVGYQCSICFSMLSNMLLAVHSYIL